MTEAMQGSTMPPRVAALWDAIEAAGVPGVEGVWQLPGGGSRFILVVSIKQLHAGHAKMAGLVTAGCGPGSEQPSVALMIHRTTSIEVAASSVRLFIDQFPT